MVLEMTGKALMGLGVLAFAAWALVEAGYTTLVPLPWLLMAFIIVAAFAAFVTGFCLWLNYPKHDQPYDYYS